MKILRYLQFYLCENTSHRGSVRFLDYGYEFFVFCFFRFSGKMAVKMAKKKNKALNFSAFCSG